MLHNSQIVGHDVVATNGGHSHASDIWAAGIVLYTLLVGHTPFETQEVETIYRRIKAGCTGVSGGETCAEPRGRSTSRPP